MSFSAGRARLAGAACVLFVAIAPSTAAAAVPHTVQPGETLWSIAAANNFTTRSLAAANGLSPDAQVVLGRTIMVPSVGEAAGALTGSAPAATGAAPRPMGGYIVQPGDTLSAIAARSGVAVSRVAWMNGLDPAGLLLAGRSLKLPTGAPVSAAPAAPALPASGAAPHPTAERVTPGEVGSLAASHGVPPALATAIAYQESGFNNALTSSANARGVMQILPGTWGFVQRDLASSPLNPSSARENVHAGVMYLGELLRNTGGDSYTATAAYYQGLGSVRQSGLLPDTRRYVSNVMALRQRYAGR
jgi:LysM repeat protein